MLMNWAFLSQLSHMSLWLRGLCCFLQLNYVALRPSPGLFELDAPCASLTIVPLLPPCGAGLLGFGEPLAFS